MACEPAIKFRQPVIRVDRVVYAIDYPHQYAVDEVAVVGNMQMSDENKKKYFQTNAQRVFKINI